MKRTLFVLTAVTLGFVTPAAAGDKIYRGGTLLTENISGQPYWAVQAQCAGVYGAASTYLADKGDAAGAEQAKAMGVTFFRDAVTRVMKDRGVTKPAAIEALSPTVISVRADSLQNLQAEGNGPSSKWNFARSACLDVRESYASN